MPLGIGTLLGAAVAGGILAAVTEPAARLPDTAVLVALGCVLAFAVADVVGRRGVTFPKRQTAGDAVRYSGPRLGQAIWGFDLALGFSTFRTSRLYWAGLILLGLGGSPVFCYVATFGYSAAFLLSVRRRRFYLVPEEWMIRRRHRLGLLGVVVAAGLLALVVAGGGAGA